MLCFTVKHQKLCEWLWENENKNKDKVDILLDKIKEENNFEDIALDQIKRKLVTTFLSKYKQYWNLSSRRKDFFVKKHQQFLNNIFKISLNTSINANLTDSNKKREQPCRQYEHVSQKMKQRKFNNIRPQLNIDQLKATTAPFIDNINNTNNAGSDDCVADTDSFEISNKSLAMFMDLQLSRNDYETLRKYNENICGDKMYPPYSHIQQAKHMCYLKNIQVTDRKASIDLQSLLDHTVERLLLSLDPRILDDYCGKRLTLELKWGMDGASGQQTVKQKWNRCNPNNVQNKELSDATVFLVSIVPLQLIYEYNIIWRNERPASSRYCRPVKFEFTKETSKNTLDEYNYYSRAIKLLKVYKVTVNEKYFKVKYDMNCTIIDGKTCSILSHQLSSNKCNICDVEPSRVNNLEYIRSLSNKTEYFHFGLHPLHARIRFLEHVLHVAYNLDFKEYQAKGQNKIIKLARKKLIQQQIKASLGFEVDKVKQGYGTSNDGNMSRRFFAAADKISVITGIDRRLLQKYEIILQVLNCGYDIDVEKFKQYADETANLYVTLYDWYPMPPSVHKILIHGWRIIKSFGLPSGCFTEETQETNNKVLKNARTNNSRWCSRQLCNEDVIHHLLVTSDLYISSLRIRKEKKCKSYQKKQKNG